MADYLVPGIRIYLDRIVDWEGQLTLLRGPGVDVEAEVGAYRTLIETAASLSASFEAAAREHWLDEAELTEDGGAQPPAHMRAAYDKLRETGLVSLLVEEEYDGVGMPALVNIMCTELIARADASLMTVWALQTGIAQDVQKYGSEEVKKAFLPRFASGEVQGCMDLTEPQAGPTAAPRCTSSWRATTIVSRNRRARRTDSPSCSCRGTSRTARATVSASRAWRRSPAFTGRRPARSSSRAPAGSGSERRARASRRCWIS
jgi:hypothetical protein